MRILRLVDADDIAVEFHPFVTVVAGLSDEQRLAIRKAFETTMDGSAGTMRGLIEVHDIVLDLDDRVLGLLEFDTVDADVVLDESDLPGASSSALARKLKAAERRLDVLEDARRDARQQLEAADREVDVRRAALEEANSRANPDPNAPNAPDAPDVPAEEPQVGPTDDAPVAPTGDVGDVGDAMETGAQREANAVELTAAEARSAALAAPVAEAAGALARARRALEEAEDREASAREALSATAEEESELRERRDDILGRIDDDAPRSLVTARAAVEAFDEETAALLEAAADRAASAPAAGEPTGADDDGGSSASELGAGSDSEREAALEARVAEVRGALAVQESFDATPLRAALDEARAEQGVSALVPSPEALGLADRLDALDHRIESTALVERPRQSDLAAARQAIADAEAAYRTLESDVRGQQLSESDRADLEAAHAEVLGIGDELEERRFARGRLNARLAEAKAKESALLDRFGLRTYTDYLTGGGVTEIDRSQSDGLQRARVEVLEAEAALAELDKNLAAAIELEQAQDDLRSLRASARAILGTSVADEDLVDALVALRVDAGSDDLARPIERALEDVGLHVTGVGLTTEEVLRMAADWLDEHQRGEEARAQRLDELSDLERQLGDLRSPDDPARRSHASVGEDVAGALAGQATPEVVVVVPETSHSSELHPERSERRSELVAAMEAAARHKVTTDDASTELAAIDETLERLLAGRPEAAEAGALDRLRSAVVEAEALHDRVEAERVDAEAVVIRLRAVHRTLDPIEAVDRVPPREHNDDETSATGAGPDAGSDQDNVVESDAGVEALEAALAEAEATRASAAQAVDDARARLETAAGESAVLRQAVVASAEESVPIAEVEWYLLARLAAQRDVCFAGSAPMVIDGALDSVEDRHLGHLLERLERLAGAVQVVHLSDDPRVVDWAERVGEQRAAVVRPVDVSAMSD